MVLDVNNSIDRPSGGSDIFLRSVGDQDSFQANTVGDASDNQR
jgi:hypothetical protein